MPSRHAAGLSLVLLMFLSPLVAWSQTPQITQALPASASAGTLVTITGSGFGASQASGSVSIGGAAAIVGTWSDTQITATVAVGAQTGAGSTSVTNANSQQSNAFNFTVLPPNVFAGPVTYSYDELGRLVGAVAVTGDAVEYFIRCGRKYPRNYKVLSESVCILHIQSKVRAGWDERDDLWIKF